MGPLFALLFLVLCIIVVVVILTAVKDKKDRAVVGIAVGVVIVFVVGWMIFQLSLRENPEFVFRDAFNSELPADVQALQGEISAAFDLKETWLYFKASRSTVDSLVRQIGMEEINQEEALRAGFTESNGAPSYWRPALSTSGKCYHLIQQGGTSILIFNEQEGEVFFRSSRLQ